MASLLLDQVTWDLCLDAQGNIAVATEPYSVAQDVACALRLFSGELWYDSGKGVPYFNQILGTFPPAPFIQAQFVKAALSVAAVTAAECDLSAVTNRTLSGRVVFTTASGSATVTFAGDSSGLTTSIGAG